MYMYVFCFDVITLPQGCEELDAETKESLQLTKASHFALLVMRILSYTVDDPHTLSLEVFDIYSMSSY